MRRWIWALLAVVLAGTAGDGFGQVPPGVVVAAGGLEAVLAAANVPGGRFGVVVMEASTGRVVFEHEADLALNPASNAKVLTAAAALALLGPDRRFATGLYGAVVPGGLAGPLVLRGEGDPSLRTGDLYAMARELAALGVRRVDGGIVVDDTHLGSQHLPPAFEQQPREVATFRAAVGAVSVDGNVIALHVRPGPGVGAPAVVTADPPGYVEIEGAVATTDGGVPAVGLEVTVLPDGRERARVSGTFPATARGATYRRRLENPGLAAGWALRAVLEDAGIRVHGGVRTSAWSLSGLALLASRHSAPLSSLLYEVGKDSNNFYAEMVLLAIAAEPLAGAPPGPVTFQRGVQRVLDWARRGGVATAGLVVRNGSGLYDANRVSARQLAQVLRAAWRDPALRDEYVAQLAVAGDDGTLRNRLRIPGAARWVRAKTGTLDDAIALSGYVLAPDPARTLVFAFLANGVRGRGARARELADQVVTVLVRAQAAAR